MQSWFVRSHPLMVEKASLIGLKSGEYAGRYDIQALHSLISLQIPATLWIDMLSTTRTEFWSSHSFMWGRSPSMKQQKSLPVITFSRTLRWRIPLREMEGRMEYLVPRNENLYQVAHSPRLDHAYCHEPRYWSAMDRYRATLLQGKQVQDVSLWFPYRLGPDGPWEIHTVTL